MNIVITGTTGGIGKELVYSCIKAGHKVWGLSRNTSNKKIDDYKFSLCDVTKINDLKKVATQMKKDNFIPECVIIGSAVRNIDNIENNINFDNIKETLDINLLGAINTIETFLSIFKQNNKGHFILLSSIASFRPNSNSISYPSSKSAISMIFRGFDLTFRKINIPFSVVYLGPVETPMWEGRKSFIVEKPENIARKLLKVIEYKKSTNYIPFLSTILYRLTIFLPDIIYTRLSSIILK